LIILTVQYERLDLQLLPANQSPFDVHGAIEDDEVKIPEQNSTNMSC
jgi:hypothetical protein